MDYLGVKNKVKAVNNQRLSKAGSKIFLGLHVMPQKKESKDVRVFSWLTAILLILTSLIIFLMIYV